MNQRRHARTSFSADLSISAQGGQAACKGHSIDLSRGGIGFFSERFLNPGTSVQITIRARRHREQVTAVLSATVRWCRFDEAGAIIGAEFDAPISPATHPELCACLDAI